MLQEKAVKREYIFCISFTKISKEKRLTHVNRSNIN
jgi:hypothetical protein